MASKSGRRVAAGLTVLYGCILLYWMFVGFNRAHFTDYRYNFIPFDTITYFIGIAHKARGAAMLNLLGNIVLFVPFGLLLPLSAKLNPIVWTLLFAASITMLELLQLVTKRGMFDVDDIILNVFGFLIGYVVLFVVRSLLLSK
ncbi:VanZ family protein [Paenibacillus terricola]|uniref:VanZ family protein n=1 Tax=Paenibacillus terricola TaxID=2763503 RepID=UPI00296485CA|nr:VanZ family protein [Paenibacillus terricola]